MARSPRLSAAVYVEVDEVDDVGILMCGCPDLEERGWDAVRYLYPKKREVGDRKDRPERHRVPVLKIILLSPRPEILFTTEYNLIYQPFGT